MGDLPLKKFLVIDSSVLPEVFEKVLTAKELLRTNSVKGISEAVKKVDISRSTFYKYKDYVFPFYEASHEKIITLGFLLEHKPGVLSKLLQTLAHDGANVLTINQGIPLQGLANATVSVETIHLKIDMEALLDKLRLIDGVKRLDVLGQA